MENKKEKQYQKLEETVLCLGKDVKMLLKRMDRIEGITKNIAKEITEANPELALILMNLLSKYDDLNPDRD